VIRMLHNYIGNEAFREGMKHYLTKHSYKNTLTEDLWSSLEGASGKPVGKIMSTWTSQMGFPVINVQSRTEGSTRILTLTQEKFNADGSESPGYLWCVPIKILTSSGAVKEVVMENKEIIITLDNMNENDWFKLNPEFFGYYRVHYHNEDDLKRLRPAIENQSLSQVDRLSLIDDLFALVQAGKANTVDALELMKAFKANETSYVVWSSVLNCLSKLRVLIASSPDTDAKFQEFVVDLLSNIAEEVGWTPKAGEHHVTSLMRSQILTRIGCYGHQPTVVEAQKRFADHLSGTAIIPADLRACVYRINASNGGPETFDQVLKLFRASDLHEEKERLARSLGACKDVNTLQKVLDFAISDEIRNQDSPFIMGSVAANVKGRDLAWQFFKKNYSMFYDRYKSGMLMTRMCSFNTDNFVTTEMAHEIEKFFTENPNPAERTIRQSIENTLLNAKWLEKDGDSIKKFFA
jgi:puromycin-sensitive aminopeptidase